MIITFYEVLAGTRSGTLLANNTIDYSTKKSFNHLCKLLEFVSWRFCLCSSNFNDYLVFLVFINAYT